MSNMDDEAARLAAVVAVSAVFVAGRDLGFGLGGGAEVDEIGRRGMGMGLGEIVAVDPMALREGDRVNFQTILAAARNGDLCLVSTTRKSDGAKVALVCAMGRDGDFYYPSPLAVMIEGDPFELFNDPTGGT